MKQLILTFFAVILCYSLFFDKKEKKPTVDEINYIYEDASVPALNFIAPDTLNYYTLYDANMIYWDFSVPEYKGMALLKIGNKR